MKIYSIDGLIGSGKSTLVQKLKETLNKIQISNKKIVFIEEPVKEWIESGLLKKYYEDPKRWGYTFQNSAFITRAKALRDSIEENGNDCIYITERSVATDRHVFAKMLYKSGYISDMEYELYKSWYNYFSKPIDGIIYVNTSIENSLERIKKRGRLGESNITEDYIIDLYKYHNEWLENEENVLRLDGNIDIESDELYHQELILKVTNFIENNEYNERPLTLEDEMEIEWYRI